MLGPAGQVSHHNIFDQMPWYCDNIVWADLLVLSQHNEIFDKQ